MAACTFSVYLKFCLGCFSIFYTGWNLAVADVWRCIGHIFLFLLHCLYLILPIACIISIFAVYVFMMRHSEKRGLSFSLDYIVCTIFCFNYSACILSGRKINQAFNSKEKVSIDDKHLETFIERPVFVQAAGSIVRPFVHDIYEQYKASYTSYLIFGLDFFAYIFSLGIYNNNGMEDSQFYSFTSFINLNTLCL